MLEESMNQPGQVSKLGINPVHNGPQHKSRCSNLGVISCVEGTTLCLVSGKQNGEGSRLGCHVNLQGYHKIPNIDNPETSHDRRGLASKHK